MQQALGQDPGQNPENGNLPPRPQGRDRPRVSRISISRTRLMYRMRSHSCHLPGLELEKEIGRQEEIRGVEEEVGAGSKAGNHPECRMVAMVLVEVIQVEEVIRVEEEDTADAVMIRNGEEMGTGENEVDHPDRVKVKAKDGNHVEEMMDLLHLGDLDHEVQDGERGKDHHHLQGGDHLLQPLGVETILHP